MKLLVLICLNMSNLNMSNLNMLNERKPKVCLTKGSFTGWDTRWRGLKSHALHRDTITNTKVSPSLKEREENPKLVQPAQ